MSSSVSQERESECHVTITMPKPGESDFIQVAFSNLEKNSSLSHLYDVSPPRLPIELPKVITVMIVILRVMAIVPKDINNHKQSLFRIFKIPSPAIVGK